MTAPAVGHTPGPWQVVRVRNRHKNDSRGDGQTYPTVNGWRCAMAQYNANPEREEANALVQAAAPAILEELKVTDALCQQLCSVALNPALERHLPYGLLDEVKAWLRNSRGQAVIAKATGQ